MSLTDRAKRRKKVKINLDGKPGLHYKADMNKKFFQDKGREGGKIGGKATGACKRRSPDHYKRIARLAVEARRKKAKGEKL